jgi:hypothetical protein
MEELAQWYYAKRDVSMGYQLTLGKFIHAIITTKYSMLDRGKL